MDDEHARRVGLNEAVFREVNERLQELADGVYADGAPLDLVCECGDRNCTARIRVEHEDYERARAQPRQFLVHPGHEMPEVETVIQKREGYDLIQKLRGLPGRIADETDPRS